MNETSQALTIPSAALLCENLLDNYGQPSQHPNVRRQAKFEVYDLDEREYSLLLTQRGLGSAAIYSLRVHETLNGKHESIYRIQNGRGVQERLKISGDDTYGPYEWPASTTSNLLQGCYDNQRF